MKNTSEYSLWNKPRNEWAELPRTELNPKVMCDISKAVQESQGDTKRLERFNTQVSEETLLCRVW